MLKINSDQLDKHLGAPYYLIVGQDAYLQNQAITELKTAFKKTGFVEQLSFTIDNQTDWLAIYDSCQAMNLFSSYTLLILDFGDQTINAAISSKLKLLVDNLNSDIALIFTFSKISKAQENSYWYKSLAPQLIVVNAATPDSKWLPQWIKNHIQSKNLTLDDEAIQLLCYYYESNLLALTQMLAQLSLLYPNQTIHYDLLEASVIDSAVFTPYHWLDALLALKSKRAIHILQQLKRNDFELLILLRVFQKELILLINLKKQSANQNLKKLFDDYKIWQNKRSLYTQYLAGRDLADLYQILAKLAEIEIKMKKDFQQNLWDELSFLSVQFMGLKAC